jgi:DNA-binding transcriptional MerR regulator
VLKRIGELLDEGLNLAGVAKVLELEAANTRLRVELKRARSRLRDRSTGLAGSAEPRG